MWRPMLACGVLITLACLLVVVAASNHANQQAARAQITVEIGTELGKLIDPLERDKRILAMKKPGHWKVQGRDSWGAKWEGYLTVEQDPGAYMTFGYFEWSTEAAGGRYHFAGTYNSEAREVRWTGITVRDKFGTPSNAHYKATLSRDGLKLLSGSWEGGISVPGKWSAESLD